MEKEKSGLEDKMYERFLPVLNAKKEKIHELQKYGPISTHNISENEEDDYGSATDEDPDESSGIIEGACPSNKRPKLAMDDSLGLLDDSLSLL